MKKIISLAIALVMIIMAICAISFTVQAEELTNFATNGGKVTAGINDGWGSKANVNNGVTSGDEAHILGNLTAYNADSSNFYYIIEMTSKVKVSSVKIYTFRQGTSKVTFAVYASNNGSDWGDPIDTSEKTSTGSTVTIEISNCSAKYIKLQLIGFEADAGSRNCSINEIEVWGTPDTESKPVIGFYQAALALSDDIAIRYYVMTSSVKDVTDLYVVTNSEYAGEVILDEYETVTTDKGEFYVFTFDGIVPSRACDTITATLNGTWKEESVSSDPFEYSPLQYCKNMDKDGTPNGLRHLCRNLINFCFAVKESVGYKPGETLRDTYGYNFGINRPTIDASAYEMVKADSENIKFVSATVSLTSSAFVRFKINSSSESLTATVNGTAAEIEKGADAWYITYSPESALEYTDAVSITVTDGEETATLEYSVMSYALRMASKAEAEGNTADKNLYNYFSYYIWDVANYYSASNS